MCMMCDGATRDEVRASLRQKIDTHGWTVQGVMPAGGLPGWLYTIGLTERFGHPELVLATCDPAAGQSLLVDLVAKVEAGGSLVDLDEVSLPEGSYSIGPAHPAQLRAGLLAAWTDLYGSEGRYDLPLGALVVEAYEYICPACRVVDLRQAGPILNRPHVPRSGRKRSAKGPGRKGPTRPGQYAARRR